MHHKNGTNKSPQYSKYCYRTCFLSKVSYAAFKKINKGMTPKPQ